MSYAKDIESLWNRINKKERVPSVESEYLSLLSENPYIEAHLRSIGKDDLLTKFLDVKNYIDEYHKAKEEEDRRKAELERIRKEKIELEEKERKRIEEERKRKEQLRVKREREKRLIKQEALARQIPYLIHFTRWENLDGIIQNGLCPRILLEDLPYNVEINDELRLDGHEDSVSLSIAFPNYKMFYRYRSNVQSRGWAVIVIHPSVLWEYECAFCKHNAADSRISRVDINTLKTVEAFKGMYEELQAVKFPYFLAENQQHMANELSRSFNNLKAYDPTDPQAEVLVFDVIPPEKIIGIAFESKILMNEFKGKYPNIKSIFNTYYFSARCRVRRECWRRDVNCSCRGEI